MRFTHFFLSKSSEVLWKIWTLSFVFVFLFSTQSCKTRKSTLQDSTANENDEDSFNIKKLLGLSFESGKDIRLYSLAETCAEYANEPARVRGLGLSYQRELFEYLFDEKIVWHDQPNAQTPGKVAQNIWKQKPFSIPLLDMSTSIPTQIVWNFSTKLCSLTPTERTQWESSVDVFQNPVPSANFTADCKVKTGRTCVDLNWEILTLEAPTLAKNFILSVGILDGLSGHHLLPSKNPPRLDQIWAGAQPKPDVSKAAEFRYEFPEFPKGNLRSRLISNDLIHSYDTSPSQSVDLKLMRPFDAVKRVLKDSGFISPSAGILQTGSLTINLNISPNCRPFFGLKAENLRSLTKKTDPKKLLQELDIVQTAVSYIPGGLDPSMLPGGGQPKDPHAEKTYQSKLRAQGERYGESEAANLSEIVKVIGQDEANRLEQKYLAPPKKLETPGHGKKKSEDESQEDTKTPPVGTVEDTAYEISSREFYTDAAWNYSIVLNRSYDPFLARNSSSPAILARFLGDRAKTIASLSQTVPVEIPGATPEDLSTIIPRPFFDTSILCDSKVYMTGERRQLPARYHSLFSKGYSQ